MFVYVLLFSSMKGTINGKDGCGEVYDTPEQCVYAYIRIIKCCKMISSLSL